MAESDSVTRSSPSTTFGTLPSIVRTEDPDLVSTFRVTCHDVYLITGLTARIVWYAHRDSRGKVEREASHDPRVLDYRHPCDTQVASVELAQYVALTLGRPFNAHTVILGRLIATTEKSMSRSKTYFAVEVDVADASPRLTDSAREFLLWTCQILQSLMRQEDKALIESDTVETWMPEVATLFGK